METRGNKYSKIDNKCLNLEHALAEKNSILYITRAFICEYTTQL